MTQRQISNVFLIAYTLLTIYLILDQRLGAIPFNILPVTGFIFAFLHAGKREGWEGALRLLGLVFAVSLLFECVGVATCWVYGPYHYTDTLGPKFMGLVPYMIPVVWFMMSYQSFVIAETLAGGAYKPGGAFVRAAGGAFARAAGGAFAKAAGGWRRILSVAAVGGLVMTAWDLIMDPLMVASGHWVWDVEGAYFGIPLQNFLGWWLTAFTTYALYLVMQGKREARNEAGFDRLVVVGYLVTAAGIIAAALLNGAGDLALIGFFTMAPWGVLGWLRLREGDV
jgi:uncharacterized membrane protein